MPDTQKTSLIKEE